MGVFFWGGFLVWGWLLLLIFWWFGCGLCLVWWVLGCVLGCCFGCWGGCCLWVCFGLWVGWCGVVGGVVGVGCWGWVFLGGFAPFFSLFFQSRGGLRVFATLPLQAFVSIQP
ncbi:hypothetical protein RA266_27645, partial [Pseudomonas syringae pv. tagetis]